MTTGQQLRARRQQCHLSQSQVARRIGWTDSKLVSQHERGKNMPFPTTLARYAVIYSCTVQELAGADYTYHLAKEIER